MIEPRGRGPTACGGVRVDEIWEHPEEHILDNGGSSVYGYWRTWRKQRGFGRVHPGWFPGRRRTARAVRSRHTAFLISSGVA